MDNKTKMKDPVFWVNTFLAFATPIYAYYNVSTAQLDTWGEVFRLFFKAIQNPYVITLSMVSLWNNWYTPNVSNKKVVNKNGGVMNG